MADCMHDRDAKTCPYCPAMKRSREIAVAEAKGRVVEPEDVLDEDEETDDDGGPSPLERTRHGRASLDGWEADDSASDGLGDLYELGLRHNPRETGGRDKFTDQEQRDIYGEAGTIL